VTASARRRSKDTPDRKESRRRDGRHRGREAALQTLYQWEVGGRDIDEAIATYWNSAPEAAPDVQEFASRLARGTVQSLEEIDPLVAAGAEHWRLDRMAIIDRLILRMAVYEFLHAPGTPRVVAIDEALELAKTFSADDASPTS
jgi:N utilization substance protein B